MGLAPPVVAALVAAALGVTSTGCEYVAGIGDRQSGLDDDDAGPADAWTADATTDREETSTTETETGGETTCVFDQPTVAAVAGHGEPSALVRIPNASAADDTWAIAWAEGPKSLRFNAVDGAGLLVHPDADVVMVSESGDLRLYMPRLGWAGSNLVLAYAQHAGLSSGMSQVVMTRMDPATGLPTGELATGFGEVADTAPGLSGIAVDDTGTAVALASRSAQSGSAATHIDVFDGTPSHLAADDDSTEAFGVAATWVPGANVFAMARILGEGIHGGDVRVVARDLSWKSTFPFTTNGKDDPSASDSTPPAVVGADGRVYVAWVNMVGDLRVLVLNAFDALTGSPLLADPVVVSPPPEPSTAELRFPRLVFDGATIGVAWADVQFGSAAANIRFRRFALDLTPLGNEFCPGCQVADVDNLPFSLAEAGPGRYATAFFSSVANKIFLVRFACEEK